VGNYPITPSNAIFSVGSAANYTISYVDGQLTVTPAVLSVGSIVANNATKTYGTTYTFAGTEFTPIGLVNGDTISGVTLTSAGAINTANVGNYAITPSNPVFSAGSAANYTLTYVDGQLAVTAAPLTVTANIQSKIYGTATDPALTYVVSGLLFNDTLTGGLNRVVGENVGSYAIEQGTMNNANYSISYTGNNLSITPRQISLVADVQSKMYGDADPALSFAISGSGLAAWDTNATAFIGGLTRASGEDVLGSPYAITQGTLAASSNYTLTSFTPSDLTITARPISVTADSLSKVYGDADPALTFAIGGSGLASWDTNATAFTGAITRTAGENVLGTPYAITQGTLAANSNYTLTNFTPSILAITPATLTVDVSQIEKLLGMPDPALTYSVTGLKFNETEGGVLSGALTREAGDQEGIYPILQGSLALTSSNYALNFIPNNFVIVPTDVVQRITEISVQVGVPETKTVIKHDEEEKKGEIKEVLAEALITKDAGQTVVEILPVCR